MAKRKSITMDVRIRELCEKYPIMQKLEDENVCSVEYDEGNVFLMERNDCYFGQDLTAEDAIQLSEFFAELAKYMKEQN